MFKKIPWLLALVGLIVLLAALISWVQFGGFESESDSSHESTELEEAANVSGNPATVAGAPSADPRVTRLPDGRVLYNTALETSRKLEEDIPPYEGLIIVEQLIGYFNYVYGENPVGVENFEITEQLNGKNPKKIIFIAPEISSLRDNELVDYWGTPYFFHALSGQQMDIRSAGPDRVMWNEDDLLLLKEKAETEE